MKEVIIFYVPCPDKKVAKDISQNLLAERLIACSNIFKAESHYTWKGELECEEEYVLILKTLPELQSKVYPRLEDLHPYDVPALVSYPARVNVSYYKWMCEVTS